MQGSSPGTTQCVALSKRRVSRFGLFFSNPFDRTSDLANDAQAAITRNTVTADEPDRQVDANFTSAGTELAERQEA